MTPRRFTHGFLLAIGAGVFAAACRENQNAAHFPPSAARTPMGVRQTELQPGQPIAANRVRNPLEGKATAIGEGKRLFSQYNCAGCHANGGGAIGPPLMDNEWIYGSDAANIFSAIVEGRPQGMPAFGGRIPEYQVWQLVTYIRSLSNPNEAR